ncbi:hypothetical protein HK102_008936 [Quaeritorhiza haematococci]|nr:hypothetical protein HK102_008936 [Quaeritorhiza haematococci]
MSGRTVYVSRTESFAAAHRLHSPMLSDEENLAVYGKCNNRFGHGHNYKVEVVLKGKVDPKTGMFINLTDLKACMKTAIMDVMDHRHLDLEVPFFKENPSTAENIALFIWDNMQRHLPPNAGALYEVRLHETDNNVVVYRGE